MKIRSIAPLFALSCGGLACSTTVVDLAPIIEGSSETDVLAVVHERIERLAVDDERLYWLGTHLPQGDWQSVSLRSCQRRNCAPTLTTYDTTTIPYFPDYDFSVSGGRIYWSGEGGLRSCSIAGCDGSLRTVGGSSYDEGYSYSYDGKTKAIYRASVQEPGSSEWIAPAIAGARKLFIIGEYLYWTPYDTSARTLSRVLKDGSGDVQIVIADLYLSEHRAFAVATDDTSIYWTNNALAGSVTRCPLAGCADHAEVMVSPLRAPQNLFVSDERLYYEFETEPYEYAFSSCSLPDCRLTEPAPARLDAPGALALDDRYVYVATTSQDVSPNTSEETIARIRRLVKPGLDP